MTRDDFIEFMKWLKDQGYVFGLFMFHDLEAQWPYVELEKPSNVIIGDLRKDNAFYFRFVRERLNRRKEMSKETTVYSNEQIQEEIRWQKHCNPRVTAMLQQLRDERDELQVRLDNALSVMRDYDDTIRDMDKSHKLFVGRYNSLKKERDEARLVSYCCNAHVRIEGRETMKTTQYYVCLACEKACDLERDYHDTEKPD